MEHGPKSSGFGKERRFDTSTAGRSGRDEGRGWSDAATSQAAPRVTGSHQELGERQGMDSLQSPQKDLTFLKPGFQTSGFQN